MENMEREVTAISVADKEKTFRKLIERKIDSKLEGEGLKGVKALAPKEWVASEPPKRSRILGSFLREGGAGVVVGPRGAATTTVATMLAVHIALGKPIFGWEVKEPWSVLFIDGTASGHEIRCRYKRWMKRYPELAEASIHVMALVESGGAVPGLVTDSHLRYFDDCIGHTDVIVFDGVPLEEGLDGGLNARTIKWLEGLNRRGIAVLVVMPDEGLYPACSAASRYFDFCIRVSGAEVGRGTPIRISLESGRRSTGTSRREIEVTFRWKRKSGPVWGESPGDPSAVSDINAEILRLSRGGQSNAEIGKKVGLHASNVGRRLAKLAKGESRPSA